MKFCSLSVVIASPQPAKIGAQPTATIIRKPNAQSLDAASNAVHQISNNKALTVTSKRVPVTSESNKRMSTPVPVAISRSQLSPSVLAKKPSPMHSISSAVKAADPPSISVIPHLGHASANNAKMSASQMTEASSVSIEKIPPKPIPTNSRASVPVARPDPVKKIDLTKSPSSSIAKKQRLASGKSPAVSCNNNVIEQIE